MLPSLPGGFPSFPAIGSTPYGFFGPTVLSMAQGRHPSTNIIRGESYLNPNNRAMGVVVSFDAMNLPTLPDRMAKHLQDALIFHLYDVAESVIAMAQRSLTPGHGYRTGLLKNSLEAALARHLLATGVYYDLFSEAAYYWRWVEFGHWIAGSNKFWGGYHFLENALLAHEARIRGAVREAWQDVVIKLASEARAPA